MKLDPLTLHVVQVRVQAQKLEPSELLKAIKTMVSFAGWRVNGMLDASRALGEGHADARLGRFVLSGGRDRDDRRLKRCRSQRPALPPLGTA